MARWKLTEPHYLNVPGIKWEQTLTDKSTGRPMRKVFNVPQFLHPESPEDWTHDKRDDGYIVVCHEGKGNPEDIVFVGDPTPGMLPIDDEAKAISAKYSDKWKPTTGTDEQAQMESFQQKLLNGMFDQMSVLQTSQVPAAPGMDKFMEMMAAMMGQQTQILSQLANRPAPVVDDAVPLDSVEPTQAELDLAATDAAAKEVASIAKATAHASSRRI